ncbi:MAG: endo-1,4-beta-xylanase [Gemmatimonadota bacterium]
MGDLLGKCAAGSRPTGDGLATHAAARGLLYGSVIRIGVAERDPAVAQAYINECGVLVPGTALFWPKVHPALDRFDFNAADKIYNFAAANGIKFRGHTLLWYKQLPDWFEAAVNPSNAASVMQNHITTVVGHFKGKTHSWDVVNEIIDDKSARPDGLGPSAWLDLLGPEYVPMAFRAAKAADPDTLLVYNDNHMDYDTPAWDRKRSLVLAYLTKLKSDGVPVEALGIQAHLDASETRFSETKFRQFLRDVAALGLKIIISELDVRDNQVAGGLMERDSAVAAAYSRYLSVALDEPAVIAVLTWGLNDNDTWLEKIHPRRDGQPLRPLPLDPQLQRTAVWDAIARAFDAAPKR